MAQKAAPVYLTGSSGFDYEDRPAARFLVDMLYGITSSRSTGARILANRILIMESS